MSSVANNLKKRLLTTISSRESTSTALDFKTVEYEELFNQIKVLECDQWPSDLPVRYGEEEIEQLCNMFKLNTFKVKNAYRDYTDNSHHVPQE